MGRRNWPVVQATGRFFCPYFPYESIAGIAGASSSVEPLYTLLAFVRIVRNRPGTMCCGTPHVMPDILLRRSNSMPDSQEQPATNETAAAVAEPPRKPVYQGPWFRRAIERSIDSQNWLEGFSDGTQAFVGGIFKVGGPPRAGRRTRRMVLPLDIRCIRRRRIFRWARGWAPLSSILSGWPPINHPGRRRPPMCCWLSVWLGQLSHLDRND